MKLAHVDLKNFKRFEHLSLDLLGGLDGDPHWRLLLLGDNGSGKTSVLQAIALCLSLATGKTESVETFSWPGWLADRFRRWGPPRVALKVHFETDELDATAEVFRAWSQSRFAQGEVEPAREPMVEVVLENGKPLAAPEQLAQFSGRSLARRLIRENPEVREFFPRLPGVFWFDQFRNLGAPAADPDLALDQGTQPGIGALRKYLVSMWHGRTKGRIHQNDILGQLEVIFQTVFPGRSFTEPEPRFLTGLPTPDEHYFMLTDGSRTYELAEMSAGEQAVFPLFYDFVRQQIRRSVVLIDEIDLNLHPPLAQAVLRSLPTLGEDCQFIMTTHASAIADIVGEEEIRRLPGGRLCL